MDHPLWPKVAAGIVESQSGDRELARQQLTDLWAELGADDHGLECIVAHYLADLQGDVRSELEWDQRALDAHVHIGDLELKALGVSSAAALLPSLHLNLGDGWLRAGDPVRARHHLDRARSAEVHLRQDGYGDLVRGGLNRLAARIEAARGRDRCLGDPEQTG
jgi:hypothetical protein